MKQNISVLQWAGSCRQQLLHAGATVLICNNNNNSSTKHSRAVVLYCGSGHSNLLFLFVAYAFYDFNAPCCAGRLGGVTSELSCTAPLGVVSRHWVVHSASVDAQHVSDPPQWPYMLMLGVEVGRHQGLVWLLRCCQRYAALERHDVHVDVEAHQFLFVPRYRCG
jgi:hypothetical protein